MLANVAIIVSLVTWLTGIEEQKENKLFSTWTIINDGRSDRSGVVKTAVERLHKEGFDLSALRLNETKLLGADLRGANLVEANLRKTNLGTANLTETKLLGAYLSEAYLVTTNLRGADLRGTDLREADLRGTNLSGTNLSGADLSGADLRGTNLSGADLRGTYFNNAKNLRNAQIKLACNWKEAAYLNGATREDNLDTIVENNLETRTFGYSLDRRVMYNLVTIVENNLDKIIEFKWIPTDKQANQDRIKEIEQDKNSDPKNPPDCSIWEKD
ncbi:MAG: pentapeptide repeat-containing protein [Okeania sp. SIO2C2]|uniref:pentapeptide repeat-containing protein n=1 Tax=Okeania sp. SIO2C2 TaxID=2607787 RepID=UPI0013B6E1A0|nr:pentapeptide repeat-containing protein [Okeania sp. SIO2C2]NEP86081.1 pentapeptide repeat-containing protein [Okeania sp. SIO2C2]